MVSGQYPIRGSIAQTDVLERSLLKTIVGSAALWSWGFLCFLSPILFPEGSTAQASTGLEFGFFASQASVVLFALCLVGLSKKRRIVVSSLGLLAAALLTSASVVVLVWALRVGSLAVVVSCGVVDGMCVTLLGTAWGARYSLGAREAAPMVVLSFLIAYLIYLVVSHAPTHFSLAAIATLPVLSWALWRNDASSRHGLSSDVLPVSSSKGNMDMPGELMAGIWEARVLPWGSINVLVAASFLGNLVSSILIGPAYDGAESIFYGGVIVCACIATMALVPLTSETEPMSVEGLYRITLTFSAVGFVCIMTLGDFGLVIGGAFIQGCALFLQVLVFIVVTRSTQGQGIAPLLSFSVGQAVISAVVFAGNIMGKHTYALFGSDPEVLRIVCGVGLLALFFMIMARVDAHFANDSNSDQFADVSQGEGCVLEKVEHGDETAESRSDSIERLAVSCGLTKREAEVLSYLAKGRSLPYIADALYVTTGTIKTHTQHIYRKLGINSKQELLDLVEEYGHKIPEETFLTSTASSS